MIRRLIILLLIVGCGTEPEPEAGNVCNDSICEVAWIVKIDSLVTSSEVITAPSLYWTEGSSPVIKDSIYTFHYDEVSTLDSLNALKNYCEDLNDFIENDPFSQSSSLDCNDNSYYELLYTTCSFNGEEFFFCEKVTSITHTLETDLFEVVKSSGDTFEINSTNLINFQYN